MSDTAKKVLVIVNPTAGKKKVQPNMFKIIYPLCQKGYEPTVLTTSKGGDATVFTRERAKDYDLVVCCGGDGTLNETITGMMESGVQRPIGYIPCGTTNDMANSLGLPKKIKHSAKVITEGEPCYHDVGRFSDHSYFSYIASFGALTKVSYATSQKVKNILGHFAYVLAGIKEIWKIYPYNVKLTFDDEVIEGEFIYVSVTNTTSFAGLFKFPADEVTLNDGLFELLLIRKPKNIFKTIGVLLSIVRKKFHKNKNIILRHTSRVLVETKEAVSWTIDGECSGDVTKVDIQNIPNTINIIKNKKDQ